MRCSQYVYMLGHPINWNALDVAERVVIFDTETNGVDPDVNDMLSIGWIKLFKTRNDTPTRGPPRDGTHGYFAPYGCANQWIIMNHCEYFVYNPTIHNFGKAFEINQITDEFRNKNGISLPEILTYFAMDIYQCDVYAFNVNFDVGFLRKYGFNIYAYANSVRELRVNESESVVNAVQRIIYSYTKDFSYWISTKYHLHTAFDDVLAEMYIFLHDIAHERNDHFIRVLVRQRPHYIPVIGTGKYKGVSVDKVVREDPVWIRWFVHEKTSSYEDYLRDYILKHYPYIRSNPSLKIQIRSAEPVQSD